MKSKLSIEDFNDINELHEVFCYESNECGKGCPKLNDKILECEECAIYFMLKHYNITKK